MFNFVNIIGMKSEYKNAIQSKRKICSAYLTLLSKGEKFTVTDIVKVADVNRGTFYLHYNSIKDVEASIDEELANNFKVLQHNFRQIEIDKSPEIIFDKFNEILLKDLDFYKLLINTKDTRYLTEKIKAYILKTYLKSQL